MNVAESLAKKAIAADVLDLSRPPLQRSQWNLTI